MYVFLSTYRRTSWAQDSYIAKLVCVSWKNLSSKHFYCFLSLYLHNKFINSKYVGIYHWIWCALVEVFPENIETKSGYCTWRFPLKHDMSFLVLSLKVVENCPENKTETRSINNMRITPSRFPLYIIDKYSHAFFREINDKFHLPKRLGQKTAKHSRNISSISLKAFNYTIQYNYTICPQCFFPWPDLIWFLLELIKLF